MNTSQVGSAEEKIELLGFLNGAKHMPYNLQWSISTAWPYLFNEVHLWLTIYKVTCLADNFDLFQ